MTAATIEVNLEANAQGMVRGFLAGQAAATAFERGVGQSLQRVALEFSKLSTGQRALVGLGTGVAAAVLAFKAMVGPAIAFESAFAGVRKTVEGTPAELEAIRSGLIGMSQVMPTTAVELASIAENAGQLGVAAPGILTFTRVVAELGETTDLSFDSAAQSLARFLNVTGSGVGNIEPVSDVIVELGNNSATTESQILNFGLRLASGLTIAGASQADILGLASAFSSMGIRAEAGGSSTVRIFREISDAALNNSDKLVVFAETAGLSTEAFRQLAQENPAEAFVRFAEGLREVDAAGGSLTPTFEALGLNGIRTSAVLRAAAINSELLREQLNLADNAFDVGGQRAEEYGRRVETTASRLEVLKNRLVGLSINIGTPALDAVALAADAAGDAIIKLADIASPAASEVAGAFGNAGDAAGSFFSTLGSPALGVAVDGFTGVAGVVATVLGALNDLGPAGIAAVAAAGGIAAAFVSLTSAFGATASAGILARQAMISLSSAVAAAPFLLAAGALITMGATIRRAKQDAEAAGKAFRDDLQGSLDANSLSDYNDGLDEVSDRIKFLREQLESRPDSNFLGSDLFSGGFSKAVDFDNIKQGFSDVARFLVDGESASRSYAAELLVLEDIYQDTKQRAYLTGQEALARQYGLTVDQAGVLIEKLGIQNEVTEFGTQILNGNRAAVLEGAGAFGIAADAAIQFANGVGLSLDELEEGFSTIDQYAAAIGSTTDAVKFFAEAAGVDVDLVTDEDLAVAGEADLAIQALRAAYESVGRAAGVSADQIAAASTSLSVAAGAFSILDTAAQNVLQSFELFGQTEANFDQAKGAFDEAVASLDGTTESADSAVKAYGNLQVAYAQTGVSVDEVKRKQEGWREALVDSLVAQGLTEDSARFLADAFTLTAAELGGIVKPGQDAKQTLEDIVAARREAAGRIDIEISLTDFASVGIDTVLASLNDFTVQEWISVLGIENQQALATLAGTEVELLTWEDILAIADLDADGTLAEGELERLILLIQNYVNGNYSATIDLDGSFAENEANRFQGILAGIDETTAEPGIDPDTAQAEEEARQFEERLLLLNDAIAEPGLNFNTSEATNNAEEFRFQLLQIDDSEPEPTVDFDVSDEYNEALRFLAILDAIDERTASPEIDPDGSHFESEMIRFNSILDAVDAREPTPEPDLDDERVNRKIGDLNNFLDGTADPRTAKIDLDDKASEPGRSTGRVLDTAARPRRSPINLDDRASGPARSTGAVLDQAARNRSATMSANTSQADSALQSLLAKYNQYRSKSVTLTTYNVNRYSTSRYSADGSVIPSMPNRRYADGGFDDNQYKRQKPGLAQIYHAVTPGRIFAEPETGGEAYIPLAIGKRKTAIPVFMETGRRLGVFNDGGISDFGPGAAAVTRGADRSVAGPQFFNIAAPLTLVVENARNLDENQLALMVESRVGAHMDQVARSLGNRRRY